MKQRAKKCNYCQIWMMSILFCISYLCLKCYPQKEKGEQEKKKKEEKLYTYIWYFMYWRCSLKLTFFNIFKFN